jgi:hypothetical protein
MIPQELKTSEVNVQSFATKSSRDSRKIFIVTAFFFLALSIIGLFSQSSKLPGNTQNNEVVGASSTPVSNGGGSTSGTSSTPVSNGGGSASGTSTPPVNYGFGSASGTSGGAHCSSTYDPQPYRPGTAGWTGRVGKIVFSNGTGIPVSVNLYHPDTPNRIFGTWTIQPGQNVYLGENNYGMDWGIKVNNSPICIVGLVSDWNAFNGTLMFQTSVERLH